MKLNVFNTRRWFQLMFIKRSIWLRHCSLFCVCSMACSKSIPRSLTSLSIFLSQVSWPFLNFLALEFLNSFRASLAEASSGNLGIWPKKLSLRIFTVCDHGFWLVVLYSITFVIFLGYLIFSVPGVCPSFLYILGGCPYLWIIEEHTWDHCVEDADLDLIVELLIL